MNSRFKYYLNELTNTIFIVFEECLSATIQFFPESNQYVLLLSDVDDKNETNRIIADCEEISEEKIKSLLKSLEFAKFSMEKFKQLRELSDTLGLDFPISIIHGMKGTPPPKSLNLPKVNHYSKKVPPFKMPYSPLTSDPYDTDYDNLENESLSWLQKKQEKRKSLLSKLMQNVK
jgi:hypothetical protein